MTKIEEIADEVLIATLDDWAPIDLLIMWANEAEVSGASAREIVRQVLKFLFTEGFAEAGRIEHDYVPEGNSDDVLERVIAECEALNWEPFGQSYWILSSEKGKARATKVLRAQRNASSN